MCAAGDADRRRFATMFRACWRAFDRAEWHALDHAPQIEDLTPAR